MPLMIAETPPYVKNILGYICRPERGRDPRQPQGIAADQRPFFSRNFGLAFAMAGSSYAVGGRRAGSSRAAINSSHTRAGGPAFTFATGWPVPPYCLKPRNGRDYRSRFPLR